MATYKLVLGNYLPKYGFKDEYVLPKEFLIGRNIKSNLHIPLENVIVSLNHCKIVCQETANGDGNSNWVLQDLSINGTFLNGQKLGKDVSRNMIPGDVISVIIGKGEELRMHFLPSNVPYKEYWGALMNWRRLSSASGKPKGAVDTMVVKQEVKDHHLGNNLSLHDGVMEGFESKSNKVLVSYFNGEADAGNQGMGHREVDVTLAKAAINHPPSAIHHGVQRAVSLKEESQKSPPNAADNLFHQNQGLTPPLITAITCDDKRGRKTVDSDETLQIKPTNDSFDSSMTPSKTLTKIKVEELHLPGVLVSLAAAQSAQRSPEVPSAKLSTSRAADILSKDTFSVSEGKAQANEVLMQREKIGQSNVNPLPKNLDLKHEEKLQEPFMKEAKKESLIEPLATSLPSAPRTPPVILRIADDEASAGKGDGKEAINETHTYGSPRDNISECDEVILSFNQVKEEVIDINDDDDDDGDGGDEGKGNDGTSEEFVFDRNEFHQRHSPPKVVSHSTTTSYGNCKVVTASNELIRGSDKRTYGDAASSAIFIGSSCSDVDTRELFEPSPTATKANIGVVACILSENEKTPNTDMKKDGASFIRVGNLESHFVHLAKASSSVSSKGASEDPSSIVAASELDPDLTVRKAPDAITSTLSTKVMTGHTEKDGVKADDVPFSSESVEEGKDREYREVREKEEKKEEMEMMDKKIRENGVDKNGSTVNSNEIYGETTKNILSPIVSSSSVYNAPVLSSIPSSPTTTFSLTSTSSKRGGRGMGGGDMYSVTSFFNTEEAKLRLIVRQLESTNEKLRKRLEESEKDLLRSEGDLTMEQQRFESLQLDMKRRLEQERATLLEREKLLADAHRAELAAARHAQQIAEARALDFERRLGFLGSQDPQENVVKQSRSEADDEAAIELGGVPKPNALEGSGSEVSKKETKDSNPGFNASPSARWQSYVRQLAATEEKLRISQSRVDDLEKRCSELQGDVATAEDRDKATGAAVVKLQERLSVEAKEAEALKALAVAAEADAKHARLIADQEEAARKAAEECLSRSNSSLNALRHALRKSRVALREMEDEKSVVLDRVNRLLDDSKRSLVTGVVTLLDGLRERVTTDLSKENSCNSWEGGEDEDEESGEEDEKENEDEKEDEEEEREINEGGEIEGGKNEKTIERKQIEGERKNKSHKVVTVQAKKRAREEKERGNGEKKRQRML